MFAFCGYVPIKKTGQDSFSKLVGLILSFIDHPPFFSASIGQVHKATLRNGSVVAVKIQYPGIESLFRSDISTMRFFCTFVAPEQLIIFDEIERQFMSEVAISSLFFCVLLCSSTMSLIFTVFIVLIGDV